VRNSASTFRSLAPIAFITPISLVLSVTDVYMVVTIPTEPTRRATRAMLEIAVPKPAVNSPID